MDCREERENVRSGKRKEVEKLRVKEEERTPIKGRVAERIKLENQWVKRNQGEGECIFHP